MDELVEHSTRTGIKIAVENILGVPASLQCEIFDKIFDQYDKQYLGLCYDSGHNMAVDPDSPYRFLKRYGDRLIAIHLQDVHAPTPDRDRDCRNYIKSDHHLVPFDGVLNWEYITEMIAKTNYELPLMLETLAYEGEFHATFFKRNKLVGDRLHEMVVLNKQ